LILRGKTVELRTFTAQERIQLGRSFGSDEPLLRESDALKKLLAFVRD